MMVPGVRVDADDLDRQVRFAFGGQYERASGTTIGGAITYIDANWTGLERMRAWAQRTDAGAGAGK